MQTQDIQDGNQEIVLDSWQEFHELVQKDFISAPALIYRGHADSRWLLRSSLDRLESRYPKRKNLSGNSTDFFDCPPLTTEQHLSAFKRAMRGRGATNDRTLSSDDDYWALAQHHGLATPLLDWTRSPFVALFFAFAEEACTTVTHRSVYALSTNIILDGDDVDESQRDCIRIVSPDTGDNARLIAQNGLFTNLPRRTILAEYISETNKSNIHMAYLTHIKIPNIDRDDCLITLNKMNINYLTLFPDLDGAAKHINSLWKPGYEDSLAYV